MNVKLTIFAAALFVCVSANLSPADKNYLNKIFASVKPGERKQALLHQLYLGYVLKNPKSKFLNPDISHAETKEIYNIMMKAFKFPNNDAELKTPICFPSGDCVNPDDSGIYSKD